jgi:hypothetical protein
MKEVVMTTWIGKGSDEKVLVTGMTKHFMFHILWISILRFVCFNFFSASFYIAFVSDYTYKKNHTTFFISPLLDQICLLYLLPCLAVALILGGAGDGPCWVSSVWLPFSVVCSWEDSCVLPFYYYYYYVTWSERGGFSERGSWVDGCGERGEAMLCLIHLHDWSCGGVWLF